MQQTDNKRTFYLALGAGAMLMAGVLYAWSVLKAPFISEFGWSESQLSINFTLTMWSYCLSGMAAGFYIKKHSPRPVILLGALASFAGFYGASYLTGESVIMLYVWYGLVAGCGIGLVYNPIVVTVSAWYTEKKGMCSGVLMMGFGGSTLLLGNLANMMFQTEGIGWRITYRIIACAIGVVVLLAGMVLRFPEAPAAKSASAKSGGNDCPTSQMIKTPNFWKLYFYFITLCAVGSTVINLGRDMALSTGATGTLAAFAAGIMSLCNGLGRIISGLVYDSWGRRKAMLGGNILEFCALVLICLANMTSSVALLMTGFCFAGLSYGFSPTITASVISAFFGEKNFSSNFSVTNTLLIPASFLAGLAGSLYGSSGSYTLPLIMLFVLAGLSLFLNLSIKDEAV